MCVLNSNDLVKSCMLAHSQYVKAMKDFKKVKVNNEKSWKRKPKLIKIAEVTEKKRAVKYCTQSLKPGIESYSITAEEGSDLCHFLSRQTLFATIFLNRKS